MGYAILHDEALPKIPRHKTSTKQHKMMGPKCGLFGSRCRARGERSNTSEIHGENQ